MDNDAKYRGLEMINTPQKVAQSSQLAGTAWMMIGEKTFSGNVWVNVLSLRKYDRLSNLSLFHFPPGNQWGSLFA